MQSYLLLNLVFWSDSMVGGVFIVNKVPATAMDCPQWQRYQRTTARCRTNAVPRGYVTYLQSPAQCHPWVR